MQRKQTDQNGFITMIVVLIALAVVVIALAYIRVSKAHQ